MVILQPMTMFIKHNLYEVTEMMNSMIAHRKEISVGDRVWVIDPILIRESGPIPAEVIEIRHVLGESAYFIETEVDERKLVSANQISQVEPSTR
jgi:hypothetical protein